jgi:uncharacterized membrane protein YeiB
MTLRPVSAGERIEVLNALSTVALLWERMQWRARLRPFVAVGRMALTNYLLQSLVCTTLFYSWGVGLWTFMTK